MENIFVISYKLVKNGNIFVISYKFDENYLNIQQHSEQINNNEKKRKEWNHPSAENNVKDKYFLVKQLSKI